jgi:hypothetical protein
MTERMFWFNEDNIKRVGPQYVKSGKKGAQFLPQAAKEESGD